MEIALISSSGSPAAKKTIGRSPRVSDSAHGGVVNTRSFIPHRVHASIGVFAAITVATACVIPETVAASLAQLDVDGNYKIEHLSGSMNVRIERDDSGAIKRTGIVRTARKLMDGAVYV